MNAALSLSKLSLSIRMGRSHIPFISEIDLNVPMGKFTCLVGESGCGKSVLCREILGLNPDGLTERLSGHIHFLNADLMALSKEKKRELRGRDIGFIFQEPMTALNPVKTIGWQLMEAYRIHDRGHHNQPKNYILQLLSKVGIDDERRVFSAYPHQLSGGQRQRVMIAMAIMHKPKVLLADEPTTALDMRTQTEVIQLLRNLQSEMGMGILLVTHDLKLVAQIAHHIAVMYAGEIVEYGTAQQVLYQPKHPYTQALLRAAPDIESSYIEPIEGHVPHIGEIGVGCRFFTRCLISDEACQAEKKIAMSNDRNLHAVRCLKTEKYV